MSGTININKLDNFTTAYIECALWSSMDDDGNPLDDNYGIDDLSQECLAKMAEDCRQFQLDHQTDMEELDDEQCGHDFWLTRCGHGAGFWDRGYGELGEWLTQASKAWGDVYLYVGDDGMIYCN